MSKSIIFSILSILAVHVGLGAQGLNTIETRRITYQAGGTTLIGYLAWDKAITQKRPGILVVHEWTGLNDYAMRQAENLAKEGYVAFALDMYGDGKEIPTSQARQMSSSVGSNFPLIQERFNAALDVLRSQSTVDQTKIAAIGYCFGGGVVLNMARMGTDIKGVVSFHGSLNTGLTAKPGDIKTPILAFQGEGDPAAPLAARTRLSEEMTTAKAAFEFVVYPGVNAHNFTNPAGSTYYQREATMAWNQMKAFFTRIFS